MDAGPPVPLQYHIPAIRRRSRGPAYLVSRLITSYIGYALVMAVLTLVVPRFAQVFMDFNMTIPWATRLTLSASRLCLREYLWATLLPLPALWALANYNISSPRLRRWMRAIAFFLVVAFIAFMLIALLVPLMGLMHATSGTSPRSS